MCTNKRERMCKNVRVWMGTHGPILIVDDWNALYVLGMWEEMDPEYLEMWDASVYECAAVWFLGMCMCVV